MSSVKIIYKEPEDRPIERVEWRDHNYAYFDKTDRFCICTDHGTYHAVVSRVSKDEALEWARAVLKMVEQRHGK